MTDGLIEAVVDFNVFFGIDVDVSINLLILSYQYTIINTVAESSVLLFAVSAGAFPTSSSSNSPRLSTTAVHETQADLKVLAQELNPLVKFYDPLHLSELEFWEQSEEASIGFLRHAEIK